MDVDERNKIKTKLADVVIFNLRATNSGIIGKNNFAIVNVY